MIDDKGGVKTLEFNTRMGDPETQPIMLRLKSDLLEVLLAATQPDGLLDLELEWDRRSALGVVLAAPGYPAQPRKGDRIHGLPSAVVQDEPGNEAVVFHAGTVQQGEGVVSNGGRVLCVTALGDNLRQAQQNAYAAVAKINFDGMQYRKDIGYRALK